ncbi:hypothetical protein [Bradyrhizobium sp. Ash2021]|uniref:hypothetical protein n=1 Tax=Bradyrhizobium sp. Ash2021 TaxID=2954771 RepID=UPI00281665DD|nr:hypothetical protein [Bradyrhizobium sp. Ash2021]WMT72537.1 hypothetical protein NL528_31550 [Bradyrhizobium sp. Ash2021]
MLVLLGVGGFVLTMSILRLFGVAGKTLDLALYLFAVALLPWLCAVAGLKLRYSFPDVPEIVVRPENSSMLFLLTVLFALPFLFFDFSLAVEPLHYLTVMGPAVHLLNGGILLVDTFSQYGPGPVLTTLSGFALGPLSLGTANIVVQFGNLIYFALVLVFLHRACDHKYLAILMGLIAIYFLLEGWDHGRGNLNIAPSPLARYLPTLMMVVAIVLLKPPVRHSILTASATVLSAMWSVETLVGTIAVQMVFLSALAIRERSWRRMSRDVPVAMLPAIITLGAFSLVIYAQSAHWPRFDIYLRFLSVYNPLSDYWAKPRQGFYWWIPMLVVVFLSLAHCWISILDRRTSPGADRQIYRLLPMTALCLWSALYYVGRSIDYTLLIAFLPFAAVVIVQGQLLLRTRLRACAICAGILIGAFGVYQTRGIWRPAGPYSFLLHECRDHNRCTLAALRDRLEDRLLARPALEAVGNQWADYRLDNGGVLREATSLIEQYFAPGVPATVLLGRVQYVSYLSDLALIYTGHWHRWPISFTFTDNLVPPLIQKIVATPVQLYDGEVVVVRRAEDTLEGVEREILAKIRADYHLCEIPNDLHQVTAYRISFRANCAM